MSRIDMVPGIPLLWFTGGIRDIQNLHFNIYVAQTGEVVEVIHLVVNVQCLGGPIEVAGDNYFACLDSTHFD